MTSEPMMEWLLDSDPALRWQVMGDLTMLDRARDAANAGDQDVMELTYTLSTPEPIANAYEVVMGANKAIVFSTHILEEVEQVVRDAASLGLGQLGGADVHAAVDLHRVGVDHLSPEPLGEVEAEARLARRGGSDEGDRLAASLRLGPRGLGARALHGRRPVAARLQLS